MVAVILDNRVLGFILPLKDMVILGNSLNFSELKFYFYKILI